MSRFLVVVPPSPGPTYPTVALGHELAARGHVVAWAGHESIVGPLLADDARLIPAGGDMSDEAVRSLYRRAQGLRGVTGFRFLWEDYLIPLAESMAPAVDSAVDEFEPDVLLVNESALAGAVVARRRGLRWATLATSAALAVPFDSMPTVMEWMERRTYDLQRGFGLPSAEARRDLRFSEHLVLAFTTEALVGPAERFPDRYVFVGPSLGPRLVRHEFPWDWLDPARRLVLVSLGTVVREAGARFFTTTLDALAPLGDRLQAILVAPPELVGSTPDHVLARPFVPQLELLSRVDAVVCHGGHNTVCETLAHGIPVAVAPVVTDGPIVAQLVVQAGAGIRLRFGRVQAPELRDAVVALLDDPSYREAAQRVQDSFASAGGAITAADHLERLAS